MIRRLSRRWSNSRTRSEDVTHVEESPTFIPAPLRPEDATITSVEVEGLPTGITLGLASPRARSRAVVMPFAFLLEGFLTADTDVDHLEVWHGHRKLREVSVRLIAEHGEDSEQPDPGPDESLRLYAISELVGTVRLPRTFTVTVRVVLASGAQFNAGTITGTRPALALPPGMTPLLSPLMVTSLGRTGTTWMMRLLSKHPELVLYERYPFEVRPRGYWTHWLQVMAEPGNHRESTPLTGFYAQQWSVGADPFFSARLMRDVPEIALQLAGEHVVALAGLAHQAAETYYRSCMAQFGRPNARFSVEKHVAGHIPHLLSELYPGAKEIVLVRDPRDMLASMLAFNEKRGSVEFGRDRVESDGDFVRQLARGVSNLMEHWRARREHAHLVRYEDLLTMPEDVLSKTFDYVGIDASTAMVQRVLQQGSEPDAALQFHMTSRDQSASIGRWERDLPADIQALCGEEFGPVLVEFGYS
jgi:Sulfotransferase family